MTEWLRGVIGANSFLHNLLIRIQIMYVLQLFSHTPRPEKFSCLFDFMTFNWWVGFDQPRINTLFPKPNLRYAQPIVEFFTSATVGISLIFRPQTLPNRGTAVNLGLPWFHWLISLLSWRNEIYSRYACSFYSLQWITLQAWKTLACGSRKSFGKWEKFFH